MVVNINMTFLYDISVSVFSRIELLYLQMKHCHCMLLYVIINIFILSAMKIMNYFFFMGMIPIKILKFIFYYIIWCKKCHRIARNITISILFYVNWYVQP